MYEFVALVSVFIRQYYIPNPFESYGIYGLLFNLLVGGAVLHLGSFKVVGLYYEKYSFSALGSFLYLAFYCVHTFLVFLMGKLEFNYFLCIGIIFGYTMLLIGIKRILNGDRW